MLQICRHVFLRNVEMLNYILKITCIHISKEKTLMNENSSFDIKCSKILKMIKKSFKDIIVIW